MLKTDNICQLGPLKLPEDMNVGEAAKGFETTIPLDQRTEFFIKVKKAVFGHQKSSELLPDVQNECFETPLVKTDDIEISQTEFEKLEKGGIILVEDSKETQQCIDFEVRILTLICHYFLVKVSACI